MYRHVPLIKRVCDNKEALNILCDKMFNAQCSPKESFGQYSMA